MSDMISGSFNGDAWLSFARVFLTKLAVAILICPIFLALSLDAPHLYLDTPYLILGGNTIFTEFLALNMFTLGPFLITYALAFFCFCLKPEGGIATPRQLLFVACLVAVLFIYQSGTEWVYEKAHLMSLEISDNELSGPVSNTILVALLCIVVLVTLYCYYKIFIVMFKYLVAKDKKMQFRKSIFKGLLEKKPVVN